MSSDELPSFERPPVIETVLGVQFDRLEDFRNAHLGAFWKRLGPGWPKVIDMPPIEPALERFGESEGWGRLMGRLKLTQDPSARLQIRNEAGDRMIQVQNGRLHYNWVGKGDGPYPRYTTVRPAFDDVFERFRRFVADEELGEFRPNQWEVTYVNHLPKGTVWNTPSDWGSVLVGLPGPWAQPGSARLESFAGEWHFEIPPRRGRLHVRVSHGITGQAAKEDMLTLTLTARGPVAVGDMLGLTVDEGLDLGRRVIVTTFRDITSESAHRYWGLRHGNR